MCVASCDWGSLLMSSGTMNVQTCVVYVRHKLHYLRSAVNCFSIIALCTRHWVQNWGWNYWSSGCRRRRISCTSAHDTVSRHFLSTEGFFHLDFSWMWQPMFFDRVMCYSWLLVVLPCLLLFITSPVYYICSCCSWLDQFIIISVVHFINPSTLAVVHDFTSSP